ncbi:MAG: TonB family protein, partial [Pseudomonas stutzeri]|nr:TonB family protein [Pseudomonadales bacterium]NIU63818.1 TonB family protein [Stutzerimonas stutzeri]NIX06978.1 TonB family protein [Pseudomonadales bacterium]
RNQGRYAEAEPLYQRALAIRENALGPDHSDVAQSLNNLAALYHAQGHYAEAEPLYQRALAIVEKALGPEHPHVATSLNNLAELYRAQGRYAEAEPLYQRALAIREKALGPEHPDVATSLNNLAELYRAQGQGRYAEAEPLYQRALAIWEKALGPDHPDVATSLNNLAVLYHAQGRYAEAEPLYQRALAIVEKALGPEHPHVATTLNNLAELYRAQGRYAEAEPLFQRALAIRESALGPEHPVVATTLNNLGEIYSKKGDYARAEPLYQRALEILERTVEPDHPDLATTLENYAELLRETQRNAEAAEMEARAARIRGETPLMAAAGEGHADTIRTLLAAGADVNAKENVYEVTALMVAAQKGHVAAVEVLLEAGADVNAEAKGGETPLMAAAINGHTAVVEALLAAGADPNATTEVGETPLLRAAFHGHAEVVDALLAAGADVNVKPQDGTTPLVYATMQDHTAIVRFLLDAGADVNAKDKDGWTALMWAASKGNSAAVKALLAKGAAADSIEAHLALGSAYANRFVSLEGQLDIRLLEQASAEFHKVLDMDPDNLAALEWMGFRQYWASLPVRGGQGPEKAISLFKKCIQLHPKEPEPYHWVAHMAWTFASTSNQEVRRDYNAKAGQHLKDEEPLPELLRHEFASRYGAVVDEGIEIVQEVLEFDPGDWEAIAYLNLLYMQKADQAATPAEREKLLGMAEAYYQKANKLKREKGIARQSPFRPNRFFPWPPPSPPPPPPPPPGYEEWKESATRIRVSSSAQEAKRIHYVAPVYPSIAQEAGIRGTVRLEALIAKDGAIETLRVLDGHLFLVQPALRAVQQWRYEPTLVKGEPVEVITEINVAFHEQAMKTREEHGPPPAQRDLLRPPAPPPPPPPPPEPEPSQELIQAAKKGDVAAVQALLEKGANVNAKDKGGWTALMWAAMDCDV